MANNGNLQKLLLLMIQAIDKSLTIYINSINMDPIDEYPPISTIIEDPGIQHSQKYVSLSARQGKIEAYKDGRVWYTSKNSIETFMNEG